VFVVRRRGRGGLVARSRRQRRDQRNDHPPGPIEPGRQNPAYRPASALHFPPTVYLRTDEEILDHLRSDQYNHLHEKSIGFDLFYCCIRMFERRCAENRRSFGSSVAHRSSLRTETILRARRHHGVLQSFRPFLSGGRLFSAKGGNRFEGVPRAAPLIYASEDLDPRKRCLRFLPVGGGLDFLVLPVAAQGKRHGSFSIDKEPKRKISTRGNSGGKPFHPLKPTLEATDNGESYRGRRIDADTTRPVAMASAVLPLFEHLGRSGTRLCLASSR
jgi:hypothetical protein